MFLRRDFPCNATFFGTALLLNPCNKKNVNQINFHINMSQTIYVYTNLTKNLSIFKYQFIANVLCCLVEKKIIVPLSEKLKIIYSVFLFNFCAIRSQVFQYVFRLLMHQALKIVTQVNSVTISFSNPTDSLKRFQNCKNGNEDGGHHLWKLPKRNNVLASKRWNAFRRISFSNKLYSFFIKNKSAFIILSNFNLHCIIFTIYH